MKQRNSLNRNNKNKTRLPADQQAASELLWRRKTGYLLFLLYRIYVIQAFEFFPELSSGCQVLEMESVNPNNKGKFEVLIIFQQISRMNRSAPGIVAACALHFRKNADDRPVGIRQFIGMIRVLQFF